MHALKIEVYKIFNGFALRIMENLVVFRENVHNIRNFQVISNKNINTKKYGLETICHGTPFLWVNLPISNLQLLLSGFKTKVKH